MEKDFYGFSFDGIHSSSLNILRVSDGDRYQENLQPEFEDRRTQLPGMDEEYYYGSDYRAKPIPISIAFDSVTEKQFRQIGYLFSTKKICPLILDERPYKMYMAKIDSPIELEYICFDERERYASDKPQDGIRIVSRENDEIQREQIYPYVYTNKVQRIYKGEGTIDFICPYPFARAPYKTLDHYLSTDAALGNAIKVYENVDEWAEASGLLTMESYERNQIDKPVRESTEEPINMNLYNPGDIDSPFLLYIPFVNGVIKGAGSDDKAYFSLSTGGKAMVFEPIAKKKGEDGKEGPDTGIIINTENHLVEGVKFDDSTNRWTLTGNLYNEHLLQGEFPKILHNGPFILDPMGNKYGRLLRINCEIPDEDLNRIKIFYDYLYY